MAEQPGSASAPPYRPWVRRLVQDHPGTLLTVLYLVLTSVGLVYTFAYYARFHVNVLDYADTSDFLLAALREPLAIVLALLPTLAILFLHVPEQDSTYVVPTENGALIAIKARRERKERRVQHLLEHLRPRRAGAPPLHDTTGR